MYTPDRQLTTFATMPRNWKQRAHRQEADHAACGRHWPRQGRACPHPGGVHGRQDVGTRLVFEFMIMRLSILAGGGAGLAASAGAAAGSGRVVPDYVCSIVYVCGGGGLVGAGEGCFEIVMCPVGWLQSPNLGLLFCRLVCCRVCLAGRRLASG